MSRFIGWAEFVDGFAGEIAHAREVHDAMARARHKPGQLATLDFSFVSDARVKLERLSSFLAAHYPYEHLEVTDADGPLELRGHTEPLPITADALLYWALDMAKRGYEHDCRFDGYGPLPDGGAAKFSNAASAAAWLETGREQYAAGNLSGAQISWSHVLAAQPRNADALYARAIVRAELHAWRAALADYDAALAAAPGHTRALLNRGALKDDHGDFRGALADYDALIALPAATERERASAYLNRGNTRMNLDDRAGACADWRRALELGEEAARIRVAEQCDGC